MDFDDALQRRLRKTCRMLTRLEDKLASLEAGYLETDRRVRAETKSFCDAADAILADLRAEIAKQRLWALQASAEMARLEQRLVLLELSSPRQPGIQAVQEGQHVDHNPQPHEGDADPKDDPYRLAKSDQDRVGE